MQPKDAGLQVTTVFGWNTLESATTPRRRHGGETPGAGRMWIGAPTAGTELCDCHRIGICRERHRVLEVDHDSAVGHLLVIVIAALVPTFER